MRRKNPGHYQITITYQSGNDHYQITRLPPTWISIGKALKRIGQMKVILIKKNIFETKKDYRLFMVDMNGRIVPEYLPKMAMLVDKDIQ